jgi:ABC-type phosphate/phosphonate transport system substrate-binding protein
MKPRAHLFIFFKVISAMLAIMAFSSCSETEKKLVIALKANKNPEKMLTEKESLETYLSDKLQRPVEVLIPTDSSVVVESFRNGTLDLGYLSSTDAARNLDQDTASILLIHLKMENLIIKVSGSVSKTNNTSLSKSLKINL